MRPLNLILLTVLCIGCTPSPAQDVSSIAAGAAKAFNEKNWKEAAAGYEKLVTINPTKGTYWYQLGYADYMLRSLDRSIEAFVRADKLGGLTFKWTVPYQIACCYALKHEDEKALQWLGTALASGYRDTAGIAQEDDFASLRSNPKFVALLAIPARETKDRAARWRNDIDYLYRQIKRLHYNPYRYYTPAEQDAFVAQLKRDAPQRTDNQMFVGVMELVRRLGDGHSRAFAPYQLGNVGLPVGFYAFQEGVYITEADPKHADLLGAKVISIGGHSTEEVMAKITPLISRDNDMGIQWFGPGMLRFPQILNGLGLLPTDNGAELTVVDSSGASRKVPLTAAPKSSQPWDNVLRHCKSEPSHAYTQKGKSYWFEMLPKGKTLFFQFNSVSDDRDETFSAFCTRLFKFIEENDVDRLVIDLRWNGGGNNFLVKPLVTGLVSCAKINKRGKLFVITGRNTFSAAMDAAAQIERFANPIFVGEPTGSAPNFVGEPVHIDLPATGMHVAIANLYWQNAPAMDNRCWISPTLYAPPTFAAYSEGRDPAMEAIEAFRG